MNIIEVCELMFANKKLASKRKHWENEFVKIFEIGYASMYMYDPNEVKSTDPKDYFLQHIKNNRLLGEGYPTLKDIMAKDWEILED